MLGIGEERANSESGVAWLAGWIREPSWPPALRHREWLGVFQGHEIRVATRGLFRARLCIDGKLRDKRSPLLCLDRRVPLLSGRVLAPGPEVNIVCVFRGGLFPLKIEVRVAGKSISMNEVRQVPQRRQSEQAVESTHGPVFLAPGGPRIVGPGVAAGGKAPVEGGRT